MQKLLGKLNCECGTNWSCWNIFISRVKGTGRAQLKNEKICLLWFYSDKWLILINLYKYEHK